ncbi:MAG: ABC transporter ATP-binding protein [Candidatus Sumerlaeota bacterium]|nr:ABC transporter ATP-binding protein [Candidatus Sumerlaeota bacterium]
MITLARLAKLLQPHRWTVGLGLLCLAVASVAGLSLPLLARTIVGTALATGRMSLSPRPCLLLVGVIVLATVTGGASFLLFFAVAHQVTARLRLQYAEQLLRAPMEFHRSANIGALIERLTTSLADLEWFVKYSLGGFFGMAIVFAGSAAMMFVLSWRLALLGALAVPLGALLVRALFRRARTMQEEGAAASGGLISHLHALLLGIEVVKAFNAEPREIDRFERRQRDLLAVQGRSARVIALVEPIIGAIAVVIFLTFLLYGGSLAATRRLPPENLVAFLFYLLIVMPMARELCLQLARWQQIALALDRLEGLQAVAGETDPAGAIPLPAPVRGEIEFRNVVFWYGDRERAMDDVSFRIAPGESVGIVGESGAGKSTLFNLLLRFYAPQQGAISIDGLDIRGVTAHSLRGAIAFAPQDIVLFDDTILENVRYGDPSATEEEVRAACRAAQTAGFIEALPRGYETALGERGMTLSGGQRQRLAIARALLRNAPILLLDEATSSLDAQTERQLGDAMDAAMRGRTTIVIAHRLATVARLPRILVLSQGRILDDGSHEELLRRCPTYRALVATQLIPMEDSKPVAPALQPALRSVS